MKVIYIAQLFLLLFFARALNAKDCDLRSPLRSLRPRFAKHFSIDYFSQFKIVHSGKHDYLLSDHPLDCQLNLIKVTTPVKKVAMTSTTYLPSLELLYVEKSLIAFQGKRYIVSKKFDLKNVQEISYKLNPEELLKLRPGLVMAYEANISSEKQHDLFRSLNLPVVMNYDFLEETPLARAEWLLFTSGFFNQEERAQLIFDQISNDYLKTKKRNSKITGPRPTVLIGDIQSGFWTTSGALSDQGQMIEDAGARLAINRPSPRMQRISLEEVSRLPMPVNFWLPQNMWHSHQDLLDAIKKDPRYLLIRAKNIYNNNLIENEDHFNDFWEMGMQRPDLVLEDLTSLFHPEQFPGHKLKWYHKL